MVGEGGRVPGRRWCSVVMEAMVIMKGFLGGGAWFEMVMVVRVC